MNGHPKCTQCGSDLSLFMMQSMRELGINADLLICREDGCKEYHMHLFYDDHTSAALYRIDRDEKETYRRLARRHRIARGEN